jgi:hypothetical protein
MTITYQTLYWGGGGGVAVTELDYILQISSNSRKEVKYLNKIIYEIVLLLLFVYKAI